jgi:hypothetical protein
MRSLSQVKPIGRFLKSEIEITKDASILSPATKKTIVEKIKGLIGKIRLPLPAKGV